MFITAIQRRVTQKSKVKRQAQELDVILSGQVVVIDIAVRECIFNIIALPTTGLLLGMKLEYSAPSRSNPMVPPSRRDMVAEPATYRSRVHSCNIPGLKKRTSRLWRVTRGS
jgi:hypothetical protein